VLLKQLGRARYGELLARQQAVVRQEVSENGGEEVDTQGDSFFVAFRSASNALACAVAIVRRLSSEDWPERVAVRVRIGIHTGEAAAAGDRYVGFSVHRAARIGAAAHGGQILLSSSTRELVEDDLPPAVFLRDLGVYRLKDVDRPERITQAAVEGLPFAFPPLRGAELVKNAPLIRRRSLLAAALAGVVAAAVAVPLFALSSGGPGETRSPGRVDANAIGAVSLASGRIVASIPLGAPPNAVAAGGDAVWAAMANRGAVSRVDPATNTVAQTIVTGGSPSAITVGGGLV
jgi:DNA-binding beta-propeller fold protein YncE